MLDAPPHTTWTAEAGAQPTPAAEPSAPIPPAESSDGTTTAPPPKPPLGPPAPAPKQQQQDGVARADAVPSAPSAGGSPLPVARANSGAKLSQALVSVAAARRSSGAGTTTPFPPARASSGTPAVVWYASSRDFEAPQAYPAPADAAGSPSALPTHKAPLWVGNAAFSREGSSLLAPVANQGSSGLTGSSGGTGAAATTGAPARGSELMATSGSASSWAQHILDPRLEMMMRSVADTREGGAQPAAAKGGEEEEAGAAARPAASTPVEHGALAALRGKAAASGGTVARALDFGGGQGPAGGAAAPHAALPAHAGPTSNQSLGMRSSVDDQVPELPGHFHRKSTLLHGVPDLTAGGPAPSSNVAYASALYQQLAPSPQAPAHRASTGDSGTWSGATTGSLPAGGDGAEHRASTGGGARPGVVAGWATASGESHGWTATPRQASSSAGVAGERGGGAWPRYSIDSTSSRPHSTHAQPGQAAPGAGLLDTAPAGVQGQAESGAFLLDPEGRPGGARSALPRWAVAAAAQEASSHRRPYSIDLGARQQSRTSLGAFPPPAQRASAGRRSCSIGPGEQPGSDLAGASLGGGSGQGSWGVALGEPQPSGSATVSSPLPKLGFPLQRTTSMARRERVLQHVAAKAANLSDALIEVESSLGGTARAMKLARANMHSLNGAAAAYGGGAAAAAPGSDVAVAGGAAVVDQMRPPSLRGSTPGILSAGEQFLPGWLHVSETMPANEH